ncbi:PP2C family protein-serine/threonine phosphatase [Paenibacillus sp. GCM10012307]|uniref:Fused response regulator/phosphatase n=1 Tax=Paenibacillus roseus TaxID=2798579 RepID=A0A934MUR0_9BACL|nr:fused response regulator/phosphatase [Paenibacillus roseus]MBJ6361347.1 fused response regulator/phosphatase [Paenibacillus roseus]
MKILVVDDNPMNVTVVKEMLKRAGYRDVHSAASGHEMFELVGLDEHGIEYAPHLLGESEYDLILLDMMMPRMDGIAVCRALQQSSRLRDIPIIMVTAIGDSKKLAEALDAGASDYVTKPINKVELLARIRVALRLKEEKDWHKKQDRKLREELQLAREVQSAVLPQPVTEKHIEIGAIYRPSEELAGDLYAWHRIDNSRYGVAVVDAMGHGISSSLVCMFIASVLKDAMIKLVDPVLVIQELNRRALQLQFADQLIQYYYTALYMVVDTANGQIEYVNAGHPPGLLLRDDGSAMQLQGGCVAIGMFEQEQIKVTKQTAKIGERDRIVLVTDGVIDVVDAPDQEKLDSLFEQLAVPAREEAIDRWEEAFFQDGIQNGRPDDRCLVWVHIKQ